MKVKYKATRLGYHVYITVSDKEMTVTFNPCYWKVRESDGEIVLSPTKTFYEDAFKRVFDTITKTVSKLVENY